MAKWKELNKNDNVYAIIVNSINTIENPVKTYNIVGFEISNKTSIIILKHGTNILEMPLDNKFSMEKDSSITCFNSAILLKDSKQYEVYVMICTDYTNIIERFKKYIDAKVKNIKDKIKQYSDTLHILQNLEI